MTAQLPGLLNSEVSTPITRTLQHFFGPGVHTPVLGPFSWADLGGILVLAAFVLIVHGLAAGVLRRLRHRSEATHPESREWRTRLFHALGKPIYTLVWIFGVYLAAFPLVLKFEPADRLQAAREELNRLLGLAVFAVVFWLFFRFTRVIEARLELWARESQNKWDDILVPLLGRSLRVVLPVIAIILALPLIGLNPAYSGLINQASGLLIVGAVAWILFHGVSATEKMVMSRYDITAADNLQARKVYTQVHVISKTLYVVITIFSLASALMMFDQVRRFGTSILASAGVVGIIFGFAAQRTIANLFAGFQLALTQPIRLDDAVIVEGEWGRIEEITLTYVVVHIWDDRRLIVPLSYFIEKPFQNWTRTSANLLGAVLIWVDYTLPIEEVRGQLKQIVESCQDWDRRFWNLQVVDATEHTMQLRLLVTAADAPRAWNLRCEVREKFLALLQKKYPQSLPRARVELGNDRSRVELRTEPRGTE